MGTPSLPRRPRAVMSHAPENSRLAGTSPGSLKLIKLSCTNCKRKVFAAKTNQEFVFYGPLYVGGSGGAKWVKFQDYGCYKFLLGA